MEKKLMKFTIYVSSALRVSFGYTVPLNIMRIFLTLLLFYLVSVVIEKSNRKIESCHEKSKSNRIENF